MEEFIKNIEILNSYFSTINFIENLQENKYVKDICEML